MYTLSLNRQKKPLHSISFKNNKLSFIFSFSILISFLSVSAHAKTLNVGKSNYTYSSIQTAIDSANDGDIVLVQDGTYVENISFNGKAVTLLSVHDAFRTVIDGNYNDVVVKFDSGEGSDSILNGFTIMNGKSEFCGGIYLKKSSPLLLNCIIKNNNSTSRNGGGIQCNEASPVIMNTIVSGNGAVEDGGGINLDNGSNPTIINCTISSNMALKDGGGIFFWGSSATIINTIFWGNVALKGSVSQSTSGNFTLSGLTNSARDWLVKTLDWDGSWTDWRNFYKTMPPPPNSEISLQNYSHISITYSNIQTGYTGDGNIDSNPMFVSSANGDYNLNYNSPCIDKATNSTLANYDIDGTRRPKGNGYDIGAHEFCDAPVLYYIDADGDGYGGIGFNTLSVCDARPDGYVDNATDCDDEKSLVYPGAVETCGDNIDQDCSGSDLECLYPEVYSVSSKNGYYVGQDISITAFITDGDGSVGDVFLYYRQDQSSDIYTKLSMDKAQGDEWSVTISELPNSGIEYYISAQDDDKNTTDTDLSVVPMLVPTLNLWGISLLMIFLLVVFKRVSIQKTFWHT